MNGSLARVPCTIVTGFLGAGKTTLIRHVLANAQGRRLAVIVNEFGDVGIDGEILKGCGNAACPEENIVELANGCLCCTVADEFVPALDAILARDGIEHIVIETSGLALPKPLVQAFHWPAIKSRVTVDGVVAVVDGEALAAGRVAPDLTALARENQIERGHELVGDGAAEATIGEFDDVFFRAGRVAASLQDLAVDADIAEFVDDHGEAAAARMRQHMADQRGLAGTEKAGDDGAGHARKRGVHSRSSSKSMGGMRAMSPRLSGSGRPRHGIKPSGASASKRAPSISAGPQDGSSPPNR